MTAWSKGGSDLASGLLAFGLLTVSIVLAMIITEFWMRKDRKR